MSISLNQTVTLGIVSSSNPPACAAQRFVIVMSQSSISESLTRDHSPPRRSCEIQGDSPQELLEQARLKFHELGFETYHASIPTRCLEIVIALTALLILAPVMLVIAILIRRGSSGSVLFEQIRIREGLKPFKFYKFRSLYEDGESRFPELYRFDRSHESDGDFMFKVENDPRMTPQGVWLRSTSLDELPNFWNLLKGEIALVGPRPEIPEMLPNYENHMLKKFSVRPGITGLAQVSGRSDLSFLQTLECDLDYVERRSFALDVQILVRTAIKCVTGEGAR